MSESVHQYVVEQLQAAKGRWPEIADKSGVSIRTIQKIAGRKHPPKPVENLETLATLFRGKQKRRN